MKALIGVVGFLGLILLAMYTGFNVAGAMLDDEPETGAVYIHCEGDRDYVAPKDEYYVIVRSGRIYIYENGSNPSHPVMIIKQPTCAIDWDAEPAEQPTIQPAPVPRARNLEGWL